MPASIESHAIGHCRRTDGNAEKRCADKKSILKTTMGTMGILEIMTNAIIGLFSDFDIDWNLGKLSVRGKSGQRSDLPLSAEVGKAIAAYLRHGPPQSTSRRVFLRAKAPIRGFLGQSGVGSITRPGAMCSIFAIAISVLSLGCLLDSS
jgi:hypothetical protein